MVTRFWAISQVELSAPWCLRLLVSDPDLQYSAEADVQSTGQWWGDAMNAVVRKAQDLIISTQAEKFGGFTRSCLKASVSTRYWPFTDAKPQIIGSQIHW